MISQEDKFIEVLTAYFKRITTELRKFTFQGKEIGLDIFIIDFLGKNPKSSMKNLSVFLDVIPSTATKRIDRLVDFGFVERKNSDEDRRIVELYLSPDGNELYKYFLQKRLAVMGEIKKHFKEEELNSYIIIIERLINLGVKFSFSD